MILVRLTAFPELVQAQALMELPVDPVEVLVRVGCWPIPKLTPTSRRQAQAEPEAEELDLHSYLKLTVRSDRLPYIQYTTILNRPKPLADAKPPESQSAKTVGSGRIRMAAPRPHLLRVVRAKEAPPPRRGSNINRGRCAATARRAQAERTLDRELNKEGGGSSALVFDAWGKPASPASLFLFVNIHSGARPEGVADCHPAAS